MHIANSENFTRAELTGQLEYLTRYGITSIRDVGSDARQMAELKRAVNTGEITGPDIYYSAFIATGAYYGNYLDKAWTAGLEEDFAPWMQLVEPGTDLDSVMIAAKATGATGVKIYHGYDKYYIAQIVAAAKRHGLQPWSHAMLYLAKPTDVAASGVTVMSHVYMLENDAFEGDIYDYTEGEAQKANTDMLNIRLDSFIENALKNDVILDATILVSVSANDPDSPENWNRLFIRI